MRELNGLIEQLEQINKKQGEKTMEKKLQELLSRLDNQIEAIDSAISCIAEDILYMNNIAKEMISDVKEMRELIKED